MKDNMCILPWIHLHAFANGKVYPCCLASYDYSVGDSRESSFAEIWNSERMKELRLTMLQDKKHSACNKCFETERFGSTSMRQHMNNSFKHKFSNIDSTLPDGTVEKVDMSYMDIRFSNICNFKCRSCGPDFSSMWKDEWEQMHQGSWPRITRVKNTIEEIWDDIETWIDTVEKIYFAGGEPLIMDEHYRILQYLIDNNKTDIELSYNSNLSKLVYKHHNVIDLWKNFKHVRVEASLDGYGKHAEYIRRGTVWQDIENNIEHLRSTSPEVDFKISCTVSAYNALHCIDFFQYCIDKKWVTKHDFFINIVQFPEHLRAQVLPDSVLQIALQKVDKYIRDYNITDAHLTQLEAYKKFLSDKKVDKFDYFVSWSRKLDEIRSESLNDILPELEEFYE